MRELIRHIIHEHTKKLNKVNTGVKQTKEEFVDKANKVHNNKYDYSKTVYVNSKTPVEIICPEHGSFFQAPSNHIGGQGCKECGFESNKEKFRKNLDKFKEQANIIHNNKYDYSKVNYVNNRTPVEIICPEHGSFFQSPGSHLSGRRCPVCGRNSGIEKHIIWTKDNVLSAASNYETISDFGKNEPGALMAARKNGWMDEIRPMMKVMKKSWAKDELINLAQNYDNKTDFDEDNPNIRQYAIRHGWWNEITSHMKSSESRGERFVKTILTNNNISFDTQKKFTDCTSKRGKYCKKLPFDFYLPTFNSCIEYDGRQHFEPVYGDEQLKIQQTIDNLKNLYCLNKGIKLIRIPYTMKKEDIESYILSELGM